jgi:hypothetical protein
LNAVYTALQALIAASIVRVRIMPHHIVDHFIPPAALKEAILRPAEIGAGTLKRAWFAKLGRVRLDWVDIID